HLGYMHTEHVRPVDARNLHVRRGVRLVTCGATESHATELLRSCASRPPIVSRGWVRAHMARRRSFITAQTAQYHTALSTTLRSGCPRTKRRALSTMISRRRSSRYGP